MIELVSIIASAAVAITAILGLVYAHYKEMAEVRERVARLETKVEPIWDIIKTHVLEALRPKGSNPEPLTARDKKKDELLVKLQRAIMTPGEAQELRGILNEDLAKAQSEGNTAIVVAIALALGLLTTTMATGEIRKR